MHKAKLYNKKNVIIWGSGKPIRDFIYVDDLASASLFVMQKYKSKKPINISYGQSYSIRETAYMIKKIVKLVAIF